MVNKKESPTFELVVLCASRSVGSWDIIKEILVSQGVDLDEIVEFDEKPSTRLAVYFKSAIKAKALKRKLSRLKLSGVGVAIKRLVKKDWFTKWHEEFKPFMLTQSIRVVPAWMKEKIKKGRCRDIYLDADLAFGSGLHPTTRFMSELIEGCRGCFKSFLDIGTGSGILALVAMVNEAAQVSVIDLSTDAVRTARENFDRNGYRAKGIFRKRVEDFKPNQKFDLVAANLITQDLVNLKRKLFRLVKKQRYLAVSGISVNNCSYFRKEFESLPLRCLKIKKAEGWCAFLYKRI